LHRVYNSLPPGVHAPTVSAHQVTTRAEIKSPNITKGIIGKLIAHLNLIIASNIAKGTII
jgi:hypothetical protein